MIPEEAGGPTMVECRAPIQSESTSAIYKAALIYAARFGLSVFPCRPRAKTPLTSHGVKDATQDPETIRSWWARWPDANVAVACGRASQQLLVLDVDGEEGQEWVRASESQFGPLQTAMTLTGKGSQYWYRASQMHKNRVRIAPGIDIRSNEGYVIAPPSVHPNGKMYCWEVSHRIDELGIQAIPDWLTNVLTQGDQPAPKGKVDGYWRALAAQGVTEGSRNQAVAELAGHLLRRYVDGHVALELLLAWNGSRNRPPLSDGEVKRTVESVAGMECRRRLRKANHD